MGLISRVSSRTYRDIKIMSTISNCKSILREIYRISAFSGKTKFAEVRETQLYSGVMNEYRKYQFSSNNNNRHIVAAKQDEVNFLKFLQANKKHSELLAEYHTKGEKSVAEAAEMVGLRT